MAAPTPPSLTAPGSSSVGGPAVGAPAAGVGMLMFHGDAFLGEVEVFPMVVEESEGGLPFPSNEIRVSHLSPAGGKFLPLANLQIVAPFSVPCKLQAKATIPLNPNLCILYNTCFEERKTAVVALGDELELHLVAMPSKMVNVPCFWCFSVRSGLYAASVGMLNLHRIAIVFDLDETLIAANSMKSFEDRIEMLSRRMEVEEDSDRLTRMFAEIKRYIQDKELLKEFINTDTVTDNGIIIGPKEEVVPVADGQKRFLRPVIRLPERGSILTRINPEIRDTSIFVKLRPAWEDLKSYLISADGRKRFEVFVCTKAERSYALEMWRLLDPECSLINLQNLSERVVCVKPGFKKSLEDVFQHRGCHPKMAIVIDDRLQVWDDKDQSRVHVVPAYNPYYAPEAEMANAVPVLYVARNVAASVRNRFFRVFDENLLKKVSELFYENEILDLPNAPDTCDYLVLEDTNLIASNKDHAPRLEGMRGSEVEKILKGQSYLGEQSEAGQPVHASTRASDNEGMTIQEGTGGVMNAQSSGGSLEIPPSLFVTALQEIAQLCHTKVEFKPTTSNDKIMQFSFEVLFCNEKIGSGIGRTREEAQAQAAEEALRDLEISYLTFLAPTPEAPKRGTAMQEPSGSTLQQDQSNNFDKLSSVMSLIRELCLEDQVVVFQDQVRISSLTRNEEYHFQVELAGQFVGRGIHSDRDFAKLLAAEDALRTLKSTSDPQIMKYLKPERCNE